MSDKTKTEHAIQYPTLPGMWTESGDLVVRVDHDTLWLADPQGAVRREDMASVKIDVHDLRTAAVLLNLVAVQAAVHDININRARQKGLLFWVHTMQEMREQAIQQYTQADGPNRMSVQEIDEQLSPGLVLALVVDAFCLQTKSESTEE